MTKARLRVGIVGCGSISLQYLHNAPLFGGVDIRACADINQTVAVQRAKQFNVKVMDVDDLIDSPDTISYST